MNIAMILAGGVGSRVGAGIPKQFINVLGKPVIAYTIEIFQQNKNIDYIEVVCHPKWKEKMNEIIQQYNLTKVKWIVDGGSTFQESVINGKDYLEGKISEDDTVMIHYGGSPFTSQKIVEDVLKKTQEFGMAASCTPSYQLLGTNNGDKSTEWSVFRTADAFRVSSIYLCGITATPPHAEIHKTALGAEDTVDWKHFDSTIQAVSSLRAEGYKIFSIEQCEGSTMLQNLQLDTHTKYAVILGNEVKGVKQEVVDASDACLEIPQFGTKHSLNVSTTAGMVIWEFAKQLMIK